MEDKIIKLELSVKKVNILLQSLSEQKYGLVAETVAEIQQQAYQQLQPETTENNE